MKITDVVELRVHGVSGTPPEELLDRPLVERVAGDATAGFYRPRLVAERMDSYPPGDPAPDVPGPPLEGYAWGGLTSGAPSRAFWLLLLPFTLINVAPRTRPADPDPTSAPGAIVAAGRRLWVLWFVCRTLALTLTVVLMCAFAGIGDDLIGWQCDGDTGRCGKAAHSGILKWVVARSTAHRIALGSLLPLAALGLLWLLSHRTAKRYENVPIALNDAASPVAAMWNSVDRADAVEVGLRSRWMWKNDEPVRRLRALHVQVGIVTVLALVSAVLTTPWKWIDGMLAIAVAAYAVVALAAPSITAHAAVSGAWQALNYVVWAAIGAATIATGTWLITNPHALDRHLSRCVPVIPDGSAGCRPTGGLPRFDDTLLWLLFVELMLVLVLFVVVAWAARRAGSAVVVGTPGPRVALGGLGSVVLALVGVFLASVFTASAYLYAATWLHTGSLKPSFGEISAISRHFTVPEAILDAALAFAVSVGVLLVVTVGVATWAAFSLLHVTPTTPPIAPGAFASDYPNLTSPDDDARTTAVLRALWIGRIVDLAAPILGYLMLAGALLAYAAGGILFAEHAFGARRAARWLINAADPQHPDRYRGFFAPSSLQGTGAYLAVMFLLLLVALGAAAFRLGPTRRSVGILWDLASFWPRLAHPLAAPCYAERTVPDLLSRIRWHTSSGRGVVLAAHSQGTVISAAAVMQLHTDDELTPAAATLPRMGLLTFGCVLRRLYGPFFPAYFGPPAMEEVRIALINNDGDQRWRNLWRYSDYLGGAVASGPPPAVQPVWAPTGPDPDPAGPGGLHLDLHLVDPIFRIQPGNTVPPSPLRHSAFWMVREFPQAVVLVAGLI
jgi:hypothetical protein